jgi:hypothetical protein
VPSTAYKVERFKNSKQLFLVSKSFTTENIASFVMPFLLMDHPNPNTYAKIM